MRYWYFFQTCYLYTQILSRECGKYHWLITSTKTESGHGVISLTLVLPPKQHRRPSICSIPISSDTTKATGRHFLCCLRRIGCPIALTLKVRSWVLILIFLPSSTKKKIRLMKSLLVFLWKQLWSFKLLGIYNIILFLLQKPLFFKGVFIVCLQNFFPLFFLHCWSQFQ